MVTIKQYSPEAFGDNSGAHMVEDCQGDYVTYEDYDKLYDKWSDLNAKYDELYNSIVDVYRNM